MMHRSAILKKMARGMPCMVRSEFCNHNPETTVWAHMNGAIAGKGVGLKGHDLLGMFACSSCHDLIDGRAHISVNITLRRLLSYEGMVRTLSYLLENDMIEVKVK